MKSLTREWVKKAEADMRAAKKLLDDPQLHDVTCFRCQQAVEKYTKAILQENDRAFPRTHDLSELLDLLATVGIELKGVRRGGEFLTGFAVENRYPGKRATKRQAVAALRWCERVRVECRALLKIKPPQPKRST